MQKCGPNKLHYGYETVFNKNIRIIVHLLQFFNSLSFVLRKFKTHCSTVCSTKINLMFKKRKFPFLQTLSNSKLKIYIFSVNTVAMKK